MFYCACHQQNEDSDYVGYCEIAREGKILETCDTYEGGEYRAMVAVKEPLPYDLPSLYELRRLLRSVDTPEQKQLLAQVEHRIWVLQDNRNHYE